MKMNKILNLLLSAAFCLVLASSANAQTHLGKKINAVHNKVKALEPKVADNSKQIVNNKIEIANLNKDIRDIEDSLSPSSDSNLELQIRLYTLEVQTAVNSHILRSILENPENFDADELLEKLNEITGENSNNNFQDVGGNL